MKKFLAIIIIAITMVNMFSCDGNEKNTIVDLESISKNNNGITMAETETETETKKIEYKTLSFETNSEMEMSSIKIDVLKGAQEPIKKDHLFDGWYLDKDFVNPVKFPLYVEEDMTIYAKWLKLKDTVTHSDTSIKDWNDSNSSAYYTVTPKGFEYDALNEKGYKIKITVSYDISYRQDYNAPLDIGYAGAPKYEISLTNSSGNGSYENDVTTPKTSTTRNITYQSSAANYKNSTIRLKFSTDNIQNTIFIKNIVVTYECIKQQ